jgi:hypothetical protein
VVAGVRVDHAAASARKEGKVAMAAESIRQAMAGQAMQW